MKKIDVRYDVECNSINSYYYYHRDQKGIRNYYSIKNYLETICTIDEISYIKDHNKCIYTTEVNKFFMIKKEEIKNKNICLIDYDEIKYEIIYHFFKLNLNEVNIIERGGIVYIVSNDMDDKVRISKSLRDKNLNKIKEILI